MKVAILGAGFAGLTAAYELNKAGYDVTIYEKSKQAGGAAGGFKEAGWDWYLDFAYHHWFTNDRDILGLCKEIGWEKIVTVRPITASLYERKINTTGVACHSRARPPARQACGNPGTEPGSPVVHTGDDISSDENSLYFQLFGNNTKSFKLDSPLDLLRFPRLPLFDRIRAGLVLAFLKFGPPLAAYHKTTSYALLNSLMGKRAFEELFKPLFEKKFGEAAPEINAMFMWARITKRTPALSYPEGGFQTLANYFAQHLQKKGVKIIYSAEVTKVELVKNIRIQNIEYKDNASESFKISCTSNDKPHIPIFSYSHILINTFPSPLFLQIEKNVLPENYRNRLLGIKYLGAQTIILETKEPVLNGTYWANLTDRANPWMVAIQHTNFMDKIHFNNHHLFYLATYTNKPLDTTNIEYRISNIDKEQNTNPLNSHNPLTRNTVIKFWNHFIPNVQPLYTTDFVDHMPHIKTPVPGLYFANIELTYPYDRGTNYAVAVGRKVAKEVLSS